MTFNELSVREPGANAGGTVVDAHIPSDSDTLQGKGTAVLFVHGYNNSRSAAQGSFEGFVAGLEAASGRGVLPWPVFGIQWPGDEPNAAISAASYPVKIKVAQRAAEKVFAYLTGIFGPGGAPIALHVVARGSRPKAFDREEPSADKCHGDSKGCHMPSTDRRQQPTWVSLYYEPVEVRYRPIGNKN